MSSLALLGTGMGMGVVHVLTGPDHLSALATLSSNVGDFKAFEYGVRWGVGHSIGLVLVGSILIALDYSHQNQNGNDGEGDDEYGNTIDMPEYIELLCESIVGICMLLLGLYAFASTYHKYNNGENTGKNSANMKLNDNKGDPNLLEEQSKQPRTDDQSFPFQSGEASMSLADVSMINNHDNGQNHHHHHLPQCCSNCNIPKPIIALGIGIIHGVAGPGGVLGVIPAVQLHNWKLALIYLGSFCLTSTLTMGIYAALYGSCTHVSSQNSVVLKYRMELFSASLSIFVGMWLFLLSIGKL